MWPNYPEYQYDPEKTKEIASIEHGHPGDLYYLHEVIFRDKKTETLCMFGASGSGGRYADSIPLDQEWREYGEKVFPIGMKEVEYWLDQNYPTTTGDRVLDEDFAETMENNRTERKRILQAIKDTSRVKNKTPCHDATER